jgi:DNA helicase-2/ATP-dependent DNA helicase PcrA
LREILEVDLLEGLNEEQREAVQTVQGPLLVHAGPGSGKTRVIVHRIAFMVSQAKINPHHILAVTFSRKAAEEMKKRLDELFEQPPGVTVGTIHSSCLRILRNEGVPGLGKNFDVVDDDAQTRLVRQCMEEAGLGFEENNLRRVKGLISQAKISLPGQGPRLDDSAAAVLQGYQAALKKLNALDYDDMLLHAYTVLKDNPDILGRYQELHRYLLVDEFQDTSSLQYQVIRMLAGKHRNICVVGDPDQTIYSWRQAEMRNVTNFSKDFPGARVIGMGENYRSTGNIVEAANVLISRNHLRKQKGITTSRERGSPILVTGLQDGYAEALFIARQVRKLAAEHGHNYSDFAVLYRVNAQSRSLEDTFSSEGIPYRLPSGTPFYKRMEIQDITAWLRVLRNPADDAALLRVIKLAGKGIGPQTLAQLQAQAEKQRAHLNQVLLESSAAFSLLPPRERKAIARFQALLQGLKEESRHASLVTTLNRIMEATAYYEHLQGEDNPDERLENVMEFIALAQSYEHLNPSLALNSLLGRVSQATETAEGGKEAEAVTFSTLHGAKGLEFPTVFIAGLEEGLLPHGKSLDDQARLEEERRLCYVGITRAMDLAYLTFAKQRYHGGEVYKHTLSRFLRELPARAVLWQDSTGNSIREPAADYVAAAREPAPAAPRMLLQPGDRVRHTKFGVGKVLKILEHSSDFHVIVGFDDYGAKKLLYSLAALEKI